ncbi:two-component system sensor histidine kinase NtrB [Desulfobacula toluolica]|uniref:histidine kinase n=1 Tax=Desulfobacula toluolica (strain DSM 7467 / Tol2) TaxID=651182 RepID=K0N378_DESTT|nr:ATP-binding protein [Desulfobacula toluolica]CCK78559.1 BamV: two component system sensor protein, associated with benzoate catabolic cluster [Desulfobacula toluolica Tol2]
MIISFVPILAVDVIGSVAMVVVALLCLYKAKRLREMDSDNAVFLYLLWISTGFTVFAVSRSFGHILRQFLILTSNADAWQAITSYSGSVNTGSFMLVGLITLFFNQSWNINEKIHSSRKKLEDTHIKLMDLNQTLENKVIERTERLTSSEHKCRRIFEQSLDTIMVTDKDFKIMEINPAGIELTGYSWDEMILKKMTVGSFFTDLSEWEKISSKIDSKEYILNEETEFLRPDNSSLLVLMTAGVDYGAFGCEKSYHFIIKNVNEKRVMEQQIAQADKLAALGELSAGVAHEINNPLGIILGYTQLLLKQEPEHQEDLKIIEKHVHNCKTVVSDLLSFSRKGPSTLSVVDINKVVDGVVKFLSNHSDFRNIEMTLNPHTGDRLNIIGNDQELSQVMVNLVINACHAVDKKGRIDIATQKTEGNKILIMVKDNGKGIEKENLSRIFDPFFTTKPVGQGTGLGLSVGYGIIKRHQGDIRVKSSKGKGTVFTISLPADRSGIQAKKRQDKNDGTYTCS